MLHHMKMKARHVRHADEVVSVATDNRVPNQISMIPMTETMSSSNSSLSSSGEDVPLEHQSFEGNSSQNLTSTKSDLSGDLSGSIILVNSRPDNAVAFNHNPVSEVSVTDSEVKVASSSPLKRKISLDDSRIGFVSTGTFSRPHEHHVQELADLQRTSGSMSIVSTDGQSILKKPKLSQIPVPLVEGRANGSMDSSSKSLASSLLLLSTPDDEQFLNALHCFVRRNIECFAATAADIEAPCPGRKNPIKLGQVGLRCIHCRHVYSRDRTKRAVCYPSSISRVYHCVSDMKFDHFSSCKHLPPDERKSFDQLKTSCTGKKTSAQRKSPDPFKRKKHVSNRSGTAQYYHESAIKLGMVDSSDGIVFLRRDGGTTCHRQERTLVVNTNAMPPLSSTQDMTMAMDSSHQIVSQSPSQWFNPPLQVINAKQRIELPTLQCHDQQCVVLPPPMSAVASGEQKEQSTYTTTGSESHDGKVSPTSCKSRLLSASRDESVLNPIHCFVRNNVEVFIANEKDIAAPAPGRKHRISIGQVGLRCIHCRDLPVKQRVKRAICYPPSVSSIYHSVSNMKFDHFGACRGLPATVRQEFADLKASCSSKGGGNRHGTGVNRNFANSTAQYYLESATEDLGLFDTANGIRVRDGYFSLQEQEYHQVRNVEPQKQHYKQSQQEERQSHIIHTRMSQGSSPSQEMSDGSNVNFDIPTDGLSVLMFAASSEYERDQSQKIGAL